MIHHNVQQNTPEWMALRAGKVTASALHRILKQDGTLRDSEGMQTYINELVAERLLGAPLQQASNPWMERGHIEEDRAAGWYAFEREVPVEKCGFFTTNDGRVGASCDRLVGKDGILEIKVPGPAEHVSNLRAMTQKYKAQVQGQLYVVEGRDWVDLLSFNCDLPAAIRRLERDPAYQANMHEALGQFFERFDEALKVCMDCGAVPPPALKCSGVGTPCTFTTDVQEVEGVGPLCKVCRDELEWRAMS